MQTAIRRSSLTTTVFVKLNSHNFPMLFNTTGINKEKCITAARNVTWELSCVKEKFQSSKTEMLISEALKEIEIHSRGSYDLITVLTGLMRLHEIPEFSSNISLLPTITYRMNLLKLKNFSEVLARNNDNWDNTAAWVFPK